MAVELTAPNVHDTTMLERMLDLVQPISGPTGRPRRMPHKLHADKVYRFAKKRAACRRRGIIPRIARPKKESSERLGRHRWKVERTFTWLHHFCRLLVRYDRRADIHRGFLQLACCLIAFRFLVGSLC